MPVTEEALQDQREKNEKLRAEIAKATAARVSAEADAHNDVQMAALKAEEARLEADLAEVKSGSTKTAVRAGAEVPLAQAKEQMEAAVARKKALESGVSEPDNSAAEKEAAKAADSGKEQ